jgi:hypothetical protein
MERTETGKVTSPVELKDCIEELVKFTPGVQFRPLKGVLFLPAQRRSK